jgi:hypothetical protein
MATLTVFTRREQPLEVRDEAANLRISGFSLVLYVTHICAPDQVEDAFAAGRLTSISGPTTYEGKLRSGNALRYGKACEIQRDFTGDLQTHTRRLARPVTQNPMWVVGSPVVVCAVPVRFQVPGLRTKSGRELDFSPHITMQHALDLSALIGVLTRVSSAAFLEQVASSSREALEAVGIRPRASRPIENTLGIDVWSLTGTLGRPQEEAFLGSRDCARYSWALSAILNHSSDHVANGFFNGMSHEEVYSQMRHGYCFMEDHGIFVNNSCCLEITHFDDWTPQRSWDRLLHYGYDSSSLYLWSIAILRNETYRMTSERFGELILDLTDHRSRGRADDSEAYDECLRALRLLDNVQALHLSLKEPRSQLIDAEYHRIFGDSVLESSARSRLEGVRTLLLERSNRIEDEHSQTGITRLTLAAALLAVAALPGAVEQFWAWARGGDAPQILLSAGLMLAALIATGVVLAKGGRGRPRRFAGRASREVRRAT